MFHTFPTPTFDIEPKSFSARDMADRKRYRAFVAALCELFELDTKDEILYALHFFGHCEWHRKSFSARDTADRKRYRAFSTASTNSSSSYHFVFRSNRKETIFIVSFLLERKTRFELATTALARQRSTTEPLPHI